MLSNRFEIAAISLALTSVAHTAIGPKWMANPKFKSLPTVARAYSVSGWYQGSLFFLLSSLINYRWSRMNLTNGLTDPVDKGIAGILIFLLWGSSVWYYRHGVKDTSFAVAAGGAVQAWAAFF
ncbi:hypothetical protein BGW36DRAFT_366999 [Talaromyces proteolyticus]|uniref:Uncharacterized protein n=1 Tax=Talaromyces proteolyticus TaxID=1131652 RepID=A0AAD4L506_9EURO|nr:uncharacterized protein BGW36DRAFT_366999 [Talaromyces proteolyticus]KAH8705166.1 hypothetical protein BGW36DRAFT_366999 [Talaromyces proteolyticus]